MGNRDRITVMRRDDVEAVIQLWKVCEPSEQPSYKSPEQAVWDIHKGSRAEYPVEGILVARLNGVIVGFAAVHLGYPLRVQHLLVHPTHRESNIGERLLTAVVDFVRRQVETVGVRIDHENTYLANLLMKNGFTKVDKRLTPEGEKYSWESPDPLDMVVELKDFNYPPWVDELEKKLVEEGILFRRGIEKRHHASYIAFMEEEAPGWYTGMVQSGAIDPVKREVNKEKTDISKAWFALKGNEVVGTFGAGILVKKPLRRKGIGKVLMFKYLNDMKERGETTCDLGDTFAVSYYQQAGAKITRKYWEMRKGLFDFTGDCEKCIDKSN